MKKKINKKGMFFTILAIALLSLFLVSYSIYAVVKERQAINKRIETMNNYVFSMEQDLPRKLYISAFRIIFLLEADIIQTGTYVTNFNSTFEEAFFNGTINGIPQGLMQGVTFSGIQSSLNDKAKNTNLEINLSYPNISVTQEDPWNIKVSLEAELFIKDEGNLAQWNRSAVLDAYIPVDNFEDPLYIVGTNGLVANKINQTPYNFPITIGDLPSHSTNSYYVASTSAPSFLDRLQGINSPNPNGIESLVYLPKLSAQGVTVQDKSCVDYIYFSTNNPSAQNIPGMPAWFKLDTPHLGDYGV
jgi:hypothetical protein